MSAEGKKKRGAAGLVNAQNSPFRLNGRAPDWEARAKGAYTVGPAPSGGSVYMRGFVGGLIVEALGYGPANATERRLAHAEDRCTHPMLGG